MSVRPASNITMDSFLQHFEDPMSYVLMGNPMIDEEGHTFDKAEIERHRQKNGNENSVECPNL